jgi:hypothetical protein
VVLVGWTVAIRRRASQASASDGTLAEDPDWPDPEARPRF